MEHEHQPDHHEREREPTPRIYVASLADYNAGRLHGRWIDADEDTDAIHDAIQTMLAASSEPIAEEWAIHDYEGFGRLDLSEYEDIETVARLATGIGEHGPAFAHWANHVGRSDPDALERFEDHYLGHWPSMEDYAEQLLDDLGVSTEEFGPDWLQPYVEFDLAAFARDLTFDLHVAEEPDGVHVFEP